MKYSLNKYKYYHYKNRFGQETISAVSTYGGKTVKGYAKCDPRDTMDIESGKYLAAARCNEKVCHKRCTRAGRKVKEALAALKLAEKHYNDMVNYFNDASLEAEDASNEVQCILKDM